MILLAVERIQSRKFKENIVKAFENVRDQSKVIKYIEQELKLKTE